MHSGRAEVAWDLDRHAESAEVGARLSRSPGPTVARLEASPYGCELLMGYWDRLGAMLDDGDWTEAEISIALDLLGVPADLRRGRTPVDAPGGGPSSVDYRRALAAGEFRRLAAIKEGLIPVDDLQRGHAESGATAILTRPAALILRYERDAWRRYREAIRTLNDAPTAGAPPAPAPRVAPEPIRRVPEPMPIPIPMPMPSRPAPKADLFDLDPIESGFSTVDFAITPTLRL